MSKFVKGSLITAGIFGALGVVLCLICTIWGGRNLIYYGLNDSFVEKG